MDKIATYLKPNIKSAYNLWRLLEQGHDIVCYYFHLPMMKQGNVFATPPNKPRLLKTKKIAEFLKVDLKILTLENYNPEFCCSPDLELVVKSSEDERTASFFHTIADIDIDHLERRKAVLNILEDYETEIVYPLIDFQIGIPNAVCEMPEEIFSLIGDFWETSIRNMINDGFSIKDILETEKQFRNGSHKNSGFYKRHNLWYVSRHEYFGTRIEVDSRYYNFSDIHPYYKYLVV